jgi:hypothetical protein
MRHFSQTKTSNVFEIKGSPSKILVLLSTQAVYSFKVESKMSNKLDTKRIIEGM